MSVPLSIQALVSAALLWVGVRLLRWFTAKSSLDNIVGPPSDSFIKGVFLDLFNPSAWEFNRKISETYGGIVKIKGLFGTTQLYVFDPKAMHQILVKDQYNYEVTPHAVEVNIAMFGDGLLASTGDKHRKQRKMLNPVFSIAHMKKLVPVFWDISHKLRDTFAAKLKDGPKEIDLPKWMSRTALELIGQSGLGYSFDPLTEDAVPHPFSVAVKELVPLFQIPVLLILITYVLPTAAKIGTPRFQRWVIDTVPWKLIHRVRDTIDTLYNTSLHILELKKRALQEGDEAVSRQVAQGNDIMSILLRANMESDKEDRMSDRELLGQMTTLTFAATDTTSGALSRILHLLSTHPHVQDKLRNEITEARQTHGNLTYDELTSLPYLDAVCRETLRLCPPVNNVMRATQQDSILPLQTAIKGVDGRELYEVLVPKGTTVIVSILSANRNPDIWGPDSYKWKPERWLSPLPSSVSEAHIPGVYSHLMTFIGGGRACIGFKFSQLEMKTVLTTLLESFKFSPSKQDIVWNMNPIATPGLAGEDPTISTLPILVTSL